jgi:hypothetical protein
MPISTPAPVWAERRVKSNVNVSRLGGMLEATEP